MKYVDEFRRRDLARTLAAAIAGEAHSMPRFADALRVQRAVEAILRSDREVADGMIFMPFCFNESPANRLTNPQLDPYGKIPEFKYCAAKIGDLQSVEATP